MADDGISHHLVYFATFAMTHKMMSNGFSFYNNYLHICKVIDIPCSSFHLNL